MTIGPAPMCLSCRHLLTEPQNVGEAATCVAFPDGIPSAIYWDGRADHRRPWPGDRGVRFEQDPNKPAFDFDSFSETRDQKPLSTG